MKIEIEKPVIPQFVADWIEEAREERYISTLFGKNLSHEMYIWSKENTVEKEEMVATAFLYGYEVEQKQLYYAKNKLTGQYLGNKDIGIGSCVPQPFWFFDKGHLQIEKLPKEVFKRVYGLDDTNTDFERVE